jgi:hypothetical protein
LFSPTLFPVFTQLPFIVLFDAVRLCSTQLLSPLWSDTGCPFSETPVSFLTPTYLFPLNYGFNANFFVLVIFKYEVNTCHTQKPPANKTPELDTTIDTNGRA